MGHFQEHFVTPGHSLGWKQMGPVLGHGSHTRWASQGPRSSARSPWPVQVSSPRGALTQHGLETTQLCHAIFKGNYSKSFSAQENKLLGKLRLGLLGEGGEGMGASQTPQCPLPWMNSRAKAGKSSEHKSIGGIPWSAVWSRTHCSAVIINSIMNESPPVFRNKPSPVHLSFIKRLQPTKIQFLSHAWASVLTEQYGILKLETIVS